MDPASAQSNGDDFWSNLSSGDFSAMGMPVPSFFPTPDEVRREARQRALDVLSTRSLLNQILQRHEEVIRKRSMKKTKSTRTTILTTAWPGMLTTHRPDFAALNKEGPQIKTQGTTL
jgi:hypothetical protein